jgi:hypothetical protein
VQHVTHSKSFSTERRGERSCELVCVSPVIHKSVCASDLAFYDTQTVLCITGDTQIRCQFAPNLRGSEVKPSGFTNEHSTGWQRISRTTPHQFSAIYDPQKPQITMDCFLTKNLHSNRLTRTRHGKNDEPTHRNQVRRRYLR